MLYKCRGGELPPSRCRNRLPSVSQQQLESRYAEERPHRCPPAGGYLLHCFGPVWLRPWILWRSRILWRSWILWRPWLLRRTWILRRIRRIRAGLWLRQGILRLTNTASSVL